MTAPQDDGMPAAPVSLGITGGFGVGLGLALRVRASTACPGCGIRHVVDVEYVLQARPFGAWSLAGVQAKTLAVGVWKYRCTRCEQTGDCPAPAHVADLLEAPLGVCGHVMATGHYTSGPRHETANCPGCCPVCQVLKDAGR